MNRLTSATLFGAALVACAASSASALTVEIEETLRLNLQHETDLTPILGPMTFTATWTGSEIPISGDNVFNISGTARIGAYVLPLTRVETRSSANHIYFNFIIDEAPGVFVCSPYPYCANVDMSADGLPFHGYDLNGIRIPVHGNFGLVPDPALPPMPLDLSQATQVQHSYDFYSLGRYRTLIFYNDVPDVREVSGGVDAEAPLPGALAMLGLGLAGLGIVGTRRGARRGACA